MVNATPYTGRVKTSADEYIPAYYVRTLADPIHGTTRNVTIDSLPYRWLKVYLQIIN
jgi:hypothetical protein